MMKHKHFQFWLTVTIGCEDPYEVHDINGLLLLKYPLFVLVFSRIRFKSTCNLGFDYFM